MPGKKVAGLPSVPLGLFCQNMAKPIVANSLSWRAKQRPVPQMPATAYMRAPHCNENGTIHLYGALKYSTHFYSQPHPSLTVTHLTDEKTEVPVFDQGHMAGKCSGLCTPDLKDLISKLSREGIKNCP